MTTKQIATYDELPYTNSAFYASYPGTLATIALLHGMSPPDVRQCRVLELGCGRGGNLLPMAERLPESHFVGIDLSPRQIEEAQEHTRILGFKNVEFHAMDILDVGDRLGTFDYIVAHGVYSWIPPHVQESMLQLCGSCLSPNGIAYISYNTYPGWHYRGVVRDMLTYHVSEGAPASVKLDQARSFLDFVAKVLPDTQGVRTKILKGECEHVLGGADSYLYHEFLEPDNRPCHFHEFAARVSGHGLQYVAEARLEPLVECLPAGAHDAIRKVVRGDRIRYEQHLDFLVHRTFRRSLLCRTGVPVQEEPTSDKIHLCHFKGIATLTEGEADLASSAPVTFKTYEDVTMETAHPIVKGALITLIEKGPLAVSFDDLAEGLAGRLGRGSDNSFRSELADVLLACYRRSMVKVYLVPPKFLPELRERPVASPCARLQAQGDSSVTNLEHRSYGLDPIVCTLLAHMDGTRDHQALADVLARFVREGELKIVNDQGEHLPDSEIDEYCLRTVRMRGEFLASNGFLVG